jgi:hypothetical protein
MIAHATTVLAIDGAGAALTHVVEGARCEPQECSGLGECQIR